MFVCPACKRKQVEFSGSEAFLAHFMYEHRDLVVKKDMVCGHGSCFGRKFDLVNSFQRHVKRHKAENSVPSAPSSISDEVENDESCVMSFGLSQDANSQHCNNDRISCDGVEGDADCVNDTIGGTSCDSTAFDAALTKSVVVFISGLYDSGSFTEAQIQQIVDGHIQMLGSGFLRILKENVVTLLSNSPGLDKEKQNICRMFDSCQNMYAGFETHYKRVSQVENCGAYVKPEPFIIGEALEDRVESGCVVKVPVTLTGQFVPFRYVLKGFLELPDVLQNILSYVNHLETSFCESGPYENIVQGELWREKIKPKFEGKIVLPLTFSYDDYETNKELGSHTGVHNLGAGCMTISCLPPKYRSKLENIFLVLLIYAGDRVKGNAETFRKVIEELKYLEENGIAVVTPEGIFQIYFALCLATGDNKGSNGILGFVESFSKAHHYCRICFEKCDIMDHQVVANPAKRRTCESYEHDLRINNPTLTGRKSKCVFNELQSFHVSENVHLDTMHDLDEGVWKYLMYDVLMYLYKKKRFSIDYLNELIQGFNYGPNEAKNKPPLISHDDLVRYKRIKFCANEMRCFVRFFCLMVGHLIKDEDADVWNLYLRARQIQDITSAPRVFKADVPVLRQLVKEHHLEYMRLFKKPLKPKFHFMVHEADLFELLGPLDPLSCYRSEAKYKEGSDIAQKSHNRINLPLTIAKRHQLKFAFRLLSHRGLVPTFEYTGVHSIRVQSVEDYCKFSDIIPLEHHGVWNSVNKLIINGAQYYPEAVVLLSLLPDHTPVFGSIHVISIPDNITAYFVVRELEVVQFNKHVHAYEVKMGERWQFVNLNDLLYFVPTHIRFVSNIAYVSYRFSVSAFAKTRN